MKRTQSALAAHLALRTEERKMEAAANAPITANLIYALAVLDGEGMSTKEFGRALLISPPTATYFVHQLLKRGLAKRSLGSDRRKWKIAISAAGVELLQRIDDAKNGPENCP